MMFNRALVATDLSPASEELIAGLIGLRSLGVTEILLVRCFSLRQAGALGQRLMDEAKEPLEEQGKKLEQAGYKVTVSMVMGLPQVELKRLATTENCSLLVVGEQRHTLAGEVFFEEIAGVVTHSADRPVLVMRVHPARKDQERELDFKVEKELRRHVLFPTDFSENAGHAFSLLEKLTAMDNGRMKKITLLHVQNTLYLHDVELAKETLDQFTDAARERMEKMKQSLMTAGATEVSVELLYGTSPKREILHRIEKGDISMVLAGSQGHGYLAELFLGSVSHAVARHSEAPTLLVPMNKAEADSDNG